MKTYSKPMYAKDSERLVVFDDKMKYTTIEKVFMKVFCIVAFTGLTLIGMIGGITSKPVMDKLIDLDKWADNPANKELMFYAGLGGLIIVLGTYVLWVFLLRKKQ